MAKTTGPKPVPAYRPEDCDRLLMEAMERGDLEATVALYEAGAVLFTESGELMRGVEEIRRHTRSSSR